MTDGNLGGSNDFISLADIASLNTDDVSVLTSRLPVAGIFRVRCTAITSQERKGNEGNTNFSFLYRLTILAVKEGSLFDKTVDPETLVGRTVNDPITLWTSSNQDFMESIGLLKGRYALVGLPHSGNMGGVEGAEPGWIDGAVNHEFDIRVAHSERNGETRAYINWLKMEAAE